MIVSKLIENLKILDPNKKIVIRESDTGNPDYLEDILDITEVSVQEFTSGHRYFVPHDNKKSISVYVIES